MRVACPMTNRIALLLCLVALNTSAPVFAQSGDRSGGASERVRVAAKKEGTLLLYTTTPVEYMRTLTGDFEKRYGVKVEMWRSRSETILQRILSEARSGRHSFDVVQSISPSVEALHRERLLQEIKSPVHSELIPAAIPAHRAWAATLVYVFVQAYNTRQVKKEDLPKTYQDLLDPKWKGRLGIESSDHEWFSSIVKGMGEAKGLKFFRDLMASNGLSVRTGHPLLTKLVASGEVPLGLTVYSYMPQRLKQKGEPIDWFAIEPAIAIPDGIAVAKKAPHPNAALLFYEYMLSEDAQQQLAKIGYVPTHKKVESPIKGVQLKMLEAGTLLNEADRSQQLFEQIVTKRGSR